MRFTVDTDATICSAVGLHMSSLWSMNFLRVEHVVWYLNKVAFSPYLSQ